MYRQTQTTLKGVELVNTKYCMKIRTDDYYHNIELFYDKIIYNESKLITNNVFFRPMTYIDCHISDHILCSTTESLLKMLKITKSALIAQEPEILNRRCTEQIFTECFLRTKGKTIINQTMEKKSNLMRRYFALIPVTILKPYFISNSTANKSWRDNFDPISEPSIQSDEEIGLINYRHSFI